MITGVATPVVGVDNHHSTSWSVNLKDIGETWKRIDEWALINGYEMGEAQCLEKAHDPAASEEEVVLDLYLSIKSS